MTTATQTLVTFSRNKRTGRFDVVGPVDQVVVGDVTATKRDGTTKTVYVYNVSKPFVGKWGPTKGIECVFGSVGTREYVPDSTDLAYEDQCARAAGV